MMRVSQYLRKAVVNKPSGLSKHAELTRTMGTAAAARETVRTPPVPTAAQTIFKLQEQDPVRGAVAGMQPWQLALEHKEVPYFAEAPHLQGLLVDHDTYKPIVPNYLPANGKDAVDRSKWQIDGSKFDWNKMLTLKEDGSWTMDRNTAEFESLLEVCQHYFDTMGMYHIHSTGLTNKKQIAALSHILTDTSTNYHGGSNYRGNVVENVFDTGAPLCANLQYHHEMAYVNASVKNVQFMAMEAPSKGTCGATFASENELAHAFYMEHLGEKAREKGICYVRKLPDLDFYRKTGGDPRVVYNYWQTSFHTSDMDEAAEEARKSGLVVEWQDSPIYGRYMVTKFYTSAFEYDPYNDANRLYGAIADSHEWFDSWPGVMELVPQERPLGLTWGDDEPTTREERQLWADAYDQGGCRIPWQTGDVAFLCNHRWSHGRPAIHLKPGETRELGVNLGEILHRQGPIEGKSYD